MNTSYSKYTHLWITQQPSLLWVHVLEYVPSCVYISVIRLRLNYFLKPMQKLSPPALLSRYVEVTALHWSSTSSPAREAVRGRKEWDVQRKERVRQRGDSKWADGGTEEGTLSHSNRLTPLGFESLFQSWPLHGNGRWGEEDDEGEVERVVF